MVNLDEENYRFDTGILEGSSETNYRTCQKRISLEFHGWEQKEKIASAIIHVRDLWKILRKLVIYETDCGFEKWWKNFLVIHNLPRWICIRQIIKYPVRKQSNRESRKSVIDQYSIFLHYSEQNCCEQKYVPSTNLTAYWFTKPIRELVYKSENEKCRTRTQNMVRTI